MNGSESLHEILVLEVNGDALEVSATTDARLIFGSAQPHPCPLVTGYSSMHTSQAALAKGENSILRLGQALRKAGQLPK